MTIRNSLLWAYRRLIDPVGPVNERRHVRLLAATTLVIIGLYVFLLLVFAALADWRFGWIVVSLVLAAGVYGLSRTSRYRTGIALLPLVVQTTMFGLLLSNPMPAITPVVMLPVLLAGLFWPPHTLAILAVGSISGAVLIVGPYVENPTLLLLIVVFMIAVSLIQVSAGILNQRVNQELKQRTDELVGSEARFRAIVENSPDAYYLMRSVKNERGQIIDFELTHYNGAALSIPGTRVRIGARLRDLPLSAGSQLFERLRIVAESGAPSTGELAADEVDGTRHWYAILIVPMGDGVAIISRDITARKRTELALRESQARLHAAIESLPFEFWSMDNDGRYILQNATSIKMWGNVIGQRNEEQDYPPEILAEWQANNLRAFAGEVIRKEVVYHLDQSLRHTYNVVVPVRDQNDILGITGVNIDITETKQIEARLRALLQAMPDFLARIHRDGTYLEVIHGADFVDKAIGYDIIGEKVMNVLPHEEAERRMKAVRRALETGTTQMYEYLFEDNNGDVLQFEARVAVCGPDEALVIVRDITFRKQAEAHALQLALEREQKELLRRFVGDRTHDLMTPLTILRTSLYLMGKANSPQRRVEHLVKLESQVDNLEAMIRNMLMMLRLDKPIEDEFEFVLQDLNGMLERIVTDHQPVAISRQQILEYGSPASLPLLKFDAEKLERALANLIDNALKYTPEGGNVHVTACAEGDKICVSVRDNGPGIPAADLQHIFDRFFRSANSQSTVGGSGLGLAIVDKIVKAHGGRVEVESQEQVGTTFRVYLPLNSSQPVVDSLSN
jgi:PAS domain S-box-containing protein